MATDASFRGRDASAVSRSVSVQGLGPLDIGGAWSLSWSKATPFTARGLEALCRTAQPAEITCPPVVLQGHRAQGHAKHVGVWFRLFLICILQGLRKRGEQRRVQALNPSHTRWRSEGERLLAGRRKSCVRYLA